MLYHMEDGGGTAELCFRDFGYGVSITGFERLTQSFALWGGRGSFQAKAYNHTT